MGELPDVTPEEQSLAVDELSRVSIDFLSQMTWFWPTSSGSSSRSTKSGTDLGAGAPSSVDLPGTCSRAGTVPHQRLGKLPVHSVEASTPAQVTISCD